MKSIPQPIPYQGSKRNIAQAILSYLPSKIDRLVEPFAGSAALSISAAFYKRAERFWLNDLNTPLMELHQIIINDPEEISRQYKCLWNGQLERERQFYASVRDEFNTTQRPDLLLYLLARCVKAAIRYNSRGQFNQGPDNRRRGRQPTSMQADIYAMSQLLKGRTLITSLHFHNLMDSINPQTDLVYLDPPYQGTSTNRDPRYFKTLDVAELIHFLHALNERHIRYALSYDGHKAGKQYGIQLPSDLHLSHIEINAGRSSQSTLLGHSHTTYESLYLSPALIAAQPEPPKELEQLALF